MLGILIIDTTVGNYHDNCRLQQELFSPTIVAQTKNSYPELESRTSSYIHRGLMKVQLMAMSGISHHFPPPSPPRGWKGWIS